jgi:hypothetical protein
MKEARPTVRQLVKQALASPTDHNGEPVFSVAGYCGNGDCDTRWHDELVSTLAQLDPIPTSLRCSSCGRRLSPRGHAPYRLREHWPVTGEDWGCRFHSSPRPPATSDDVAGLVTRHRLSPPMSVAEYVKVRTKKKLKGPHHRSKRMTELRERAAREAARQEADRRAVRRHPA